MKLRKLKQKDAPFMLEWMHDSSVVGDLQANFAAKTIEDCNEFIESAQDTSKNMHLAIVDDNDTYMGTVSLKHITKQSAEFAITIRESAMGKGFSKYGMSEIIRIGIEELGLRSIYWCVAPENKRAVRFYEKNNFQRINHIPFKSGGGRYSKEQIDHYIWYKITK